MRTIATDMNTINASSIQLGEGDFEAEEGLNFGRVPALNRLNSVVAPDNHGLNFQTAGGLKIKNSYNTNFDPELKKARPLSATNKTEDP